MSVAIDHAYEKVKLKNRILELENMLSLGQEENRDLMRKLNKQKAENAKLYARYEGKTVDHMMMKLDQMQRSSGLRLLRQILAYMAKGEVAFRVAVWRWKLKDDEVNDASAQQAALAAEMAAKLDSLSKNAGIRMLQQVMVRMVKGELGERVLLWRREFEDVRKAEMEAKLVNAEELARAAMAAEVAAMQERLNAQCFSAGLKMLKNCLAYMVKGELGLRMCVWKQQVESDVQAAADRKAHAAMTEALKAMSHSAGLRMLQTTLAYLTKGDLGFRLAIWRCGIAEDNFGCASTACREERAKLKAQLYALRSKDRTSQIMRRAFYETSFNRSY